MFFSHKNLVDSQVFSPAPGYYLHVYTPVACFFISLFLPYNVEHFILMITGKKLPLFLG